MSRNARSRWTSHVVTANIGETALRAAFELGSNLAELPLGGLPG
ncbi:MAG: hypothetical protein ACRDQ5_20775 [Sciscionella sp.]